MYFGKGAESQCEKETCSSLHKHLFLLSTMLFLLCFEYYVIFFQLNLFKNLHIVEIWDMVAKDHEKLDLFFTNSKQKLNILDCGCVAYARVHCDPRFQKVSANLNAFGIWSLNNKRRHIAQNFRTRWHL